MTCANAVADTVEPIISAACECRLPAELHCIDHDGVVITGCVRILDYTSDLILADQPLYLADDGTIPIGRSITVDMSLHGERYQFETVIMEENREIRVNDSQTQAGIALRMPIVIAKSQRRSHLRVLTVGYDPISVDIAVPDSETAGACKLDAPRINGWMVDLSAGGLSVVVDQRVFPSACRGDRYYLTFRLPGLTREFNMLGSVRHSRPVKSGASLRVALSFCRWGIGHTRSEQRRVARFVANHELRMLRRRK